MSTGKHSEINNKEKNKQNNKAKSKSKNKIKSIILKILLVVFIVCVILIIYFTINKIKNKRDEENLKNVMSDENSLSSNTDDSDKKTDRMIELEELQTQNPDIVAWLEILDTDISYPILQGKDNDYYMTHNYKKEYSKDGSLFLDKDYDWDIPSSNLLIYGHNNRGSDNMFCGLLDYKDESFYKLHKKIRFTTNEEDAEYEILSAFQSRVYYKSEKNVFRYYYFINANNEKEYDEYINNCKKASLYDTGVTAEFGDQLITLSTCDFYTEDGRFAVVAKKIK